jgi:hypothetical protein
MEQTEEDIKKIIDKASEELKLPDSQSLPSNVNWNLQLHGKRDIVLKEFNSLTENINYIDSKDNEVFTDICSLVRTSLKLYDDIAVSLIINFMGYTDKPKSKVVEIQVKPLWGYCE